METDSGGSFRPITGKAASQQLLPEIDCYIHLLVVIHLLDNKQTEKAVKCAGKI